MPSLTLTFAKLSNKLFTLDYPPLHGILRQQSTPYEAFTRGLISAAAQWSHDKYAVRISGKFRQRSKAESRFSGGSLQITSSGFQFLLHSPHAQLWELLLQYLHMAEVGHGSELLE